jgi:uncharacterized protein YjbJ (UPF0337 family)
MVPGRSANEAMPVDPDRERRSTMSDKHVDEAKGRAKEAVGSVTDDDSMRREGKADQARASVKDTVDNVADRAKSTVDRDRD